jgi:hypothetical protein
MLETDKVFAGSIPENYDRHMVPLIFEPFSADLAQRAASFSPSAVLEIAAGSASANREAKRVLKPRGHLLFNVWDRIEENVFADECSRKDFRHARRTATTIRH